MRVFVYEVLERSCAFAFLIFPFSLGALDEPASGSRRAALDLSSQKRMEQVGSSSPLCIPGEQCDESEVDERGAQGIRPAPATSRSQSQGAAGWRRRAIFTRPDC